MNNLLSDPQVNPAVKGMLMNRLKTMDEKLYNRIIDELKKQQATGQ